MDVDSGSDSFLSVSSDDDSFVSIPTVFDTHTAPFSDVPNNFNIIHINAQSIQTHFTDMPTNFDCKHIHAILISESWLKPLTPSTSYSLPWLSIYKSYPSIKCYPSFLKLLSLLDLIFVSSLDHEAKHGQSPADAFSYHDLIFISYRIRSKAKHKTLLRRSFCGMNLEKLCSDADSLDWPQLLICDSIDDKVKQLLFELTELYDVHAPVRAVSMKYLPSPWLTEEIRSPSYRKTAANFLDHCGLGNLVRNLFLECCSILSFVILVSVAVITYRVYDAVTYVPDMPNLDMNAWWGPNETKAVQDTAIRPFRIVFSDAMIADLRSRFDNYRRLKKTKSFEDAGWTYGVNSVGFGQIFAYWIFKYKFSERERFLNQFDHFKTNIQGLDIHFIHVKPKLDANIKVYPLLLLHGWPGSVREFYEAIPLLTTPRPGYDYVFEVIAPSLPGFGYSEGAVRPGLSVNPMAVIMRNLMRRLGFEQYYVQAGDIGHFVGMNLATLFPNEVLGYHTNMPAVITKLPILVWLLGSICPSLVEKEYADRLYPLKDRLNFYLEESGYMHLQSTKPDTIGVALRESPAGLAAYIVEKFVAGTNPEYKFKEGGGLELWDSDALLDNVMIYWASGSITTSFRVYKERARNLELENIMENIPTKVPTWAMRFRHEIVFMPEFVLKWKYPNLLGTTTVEFGGHFAALEKPDVYTDDVFKAVKSFVEFSKST